MPDTTVATGDGGAVARNIEACAGALLSAHDATTVVGIRLALGGRQLEPGDDNLDAAVRHLGQAVRYLALAIDHARQPSPATAGYMAAEMLGEVAHRLRDATEAGR